MSLPLTSVILVSFHTGDVLMRAINSVLQQTAPVELILVDNGNPERVKKMLLEKAASDSRIQFITGHGNIGFSRGNNLGVKASHGDYVLILNPDSKLEDDTLVKLHEHAATLLHPFMIGARILNEDGTDQRGSRRELLTPTSALVEALHLYRLFPHLRLNKHEVPLPQTLSPIPAISGACMFLSRPDFDLIEGFDEGYFLHVEDLDLCFRFRKAGGEIYFAPDVTIIHIGGTSETSSAFIERHKRRGFIRYFHKNFKGESPLILLWGLDLAIWMRYVLRRLAHLVKK